MTNIPAREDLARQISHNLLNSYQLEGLDLTPLGFLDPSDAGRGSIVKVALGVAALGLLDAEAEMPMHQAPRVLMTLAAWREALRHGGIRGRYAREFCRDWAHAVEEELGCYDPDSGGMTPVSRC